MPATILSVLGGIGDTAANLKAAWGGETFEIDEMYPAYDAVAKMQGNKEAGTSIRYALTAEKDHQGIYDSTAKGIGAGQDLGMRPSGSAPSAVTPCSATPPTSARSAVRQASSSPRSDAASLLSVRRRVRRGSTLRPAAVGGRASRLPRRALDPSKAHETPKEER